MLGSDSAGGICGGVLFQHARIPYERLTPAVGPGSRNGDEAVLPEIYPKRVNAGANRAYLETGENWTKKRKGAK